jgi:hypothetical protein
MLGLCLGAFVGSPSHATATIKGYTCHDGQGDVWKFFFVSTKPMIPATCTIKGPSKTPDKKENTVYDVKPEECWKTMALMQIQGAKCVINSSGRIE